MYKLICAIVAHCTATAALADEPFAITPSGQTEAIFDLSVTETSDRVANGCMDAGWIVVSTTSTVVVCEAQMGTLQAALSQLLIGNSYSTTPKQLIRFNLAGLRGSTRVQATGWVETQMAFGQTRTEEMTSSHYHNNVMSLFQNLGGRYPPGTYFPYHAYLGASFEARTRDLEILTIAPGSPAEEAGLQIGDVVHRIARERTKGYDDILDALRKAAKNPTYDVELTRSGQKMKIAVRREYRPPVEAPELLEIPEESVPQAPQVQAIVALSPAEELAKFAQLRDDGILSEEEFEIQKARLLGSANGSSASTAVPATSIDPASSSVPSRQPAGVGSVQTPKAGSSDERQGGLNANSSVKCETCR